jgi:hypothetical protein
MVYPLRTYLAGFGICGLLKEKSEKWGKKEKN